MKDDIVHMLQKMPPGERQRLSKLLTPRMVDQYMPHTPHTPQQLFLLLNTEEALFGGAAGGGKSDALLMAALQYVDVPGYSALLLRKTWPDLNEPGAIMDRARSWLAGTDAVPRDGGRKWLFPSGARLSFGYIQHDKDKFKLQSAEYQFIGWDELTHWNESTYTYLFSRLRRPKITCRNCNTAITKEQGGWEHADMLSACDSVYPNQQAMEQYPAAPDGTTIFDIPLRMRAASNPGGVGHQWCRERFVDPKTRLDHVIFIPARLRDNPSLDQDSYIKNLQHLSPLDRERLLNGDWNVSQEGMIFHREWFRRVDEIPRKTKWVRTWDLAATKDGGDWTAGALVGRTPDGMWIIADVTRIQGSPAEVERLISATAESDGTKVPIRMEQEPGSSGVNTISHYRRNVLPGYDFDGIRPTGSKIVRANPLASAAEAGNVSIVPGSWNPVFLEEISMFPEGQHDDQTDAVTMAHGYLAFHKRSRLLV